MATATQAMQIIEDLTAAGLEIDRILDEGKLSVADMPELAEREGAAGTFSSSGMRTKKAGFHRCGRPKSREETPKEGMHCRSGTTS